MFDGSVLIIHPLTSMQFLLFYFPKPPSKVRSLICRRLRAISLLLENLCASKGTTVSACVTSVRRSLLPPVAPLPTPALLAALSFACPTLSTTHLCCVFLFCSSPRISSNRKTTRSRNIIGLVLVSFRSFVQQRIASVV